MSLPINRWIYFRCQKCGHDYGRRYQVSDAICIPPCNNCSNFGAEVVFEPDTPKTSSFLALWVREFMGNFKKYMCNNAMGSGYALNSIYATAPFPLR